MISRALLTTLLLLSACNAGPGIILKPAPPGAPKDNLIRCGCGVSWTPLACDLAGANGAPHLCDTNPIYFQVDYCDPGVNTRPDGAKAFCERQGASVVDAMIGMATGNKVCSDLYVSFACEPGDLSGNPPVSTAYLPHCDAPCDLVTCTKTNCPPEMIWIPGVGIVPQICDCTVLSGCGVTVGPLCQAY